MGLKQNISEGLRKAGLLGLFDKLRFAWQQIYYAGPNKKFTRENAGVKLPPPYFIYETYRLDYAAYYQDGYSTATELVNLFKKHEASFLNSKLLDWGCGPARVVRHFPALLQGSEIYGTDYNPVYIEWCKQNIGAVHFTVNNIEPPLTYPDNFFSGITGLSIFTHLSIRLHREWLTELYRVLTPGGILIITTQGQSYKSKLLKEEQKRFEEGKLVVREKYKLGHRLYSAFQPKEELLRLIEGKFSVAEFIEGSEEGTQDMWVLKKLS